MIRKRFELGNITRYLFRAECASEDEIYTDHDYVAQNITIKDVLRFQAIVFVTETVELRCATKTKMYLLNQDFAAKNFHGLAEYLTENGREKVILYYRAIEFKCVEDLLKFCGQGNLVVLLSGEATKERLDLLGEIFSRGKHVIGYESFQDKIFALYHALVAFGFIKYILHDTAQCQIGTDVFTDSSIGVPVHSFDLVENR